MSAHGFVLGLHVSINQTSMFVIVVVCIHHWLCNTYILQVRSVAIGINPVGHILAVTLNP